MACARQRHRDDKDLRRGQKPKRLVEIGSELFPKLVAKTKIKNTTDKTEGVNQRIGGNMVKLGSSESAECR